MQSRVVEQPGIPYAVNTVVHPRNQGFKRQYVHAETENTVRFRCQHHGIRSLRLDGLDAPLLKASLRAGPVGVREHCWGAWSEIDGILGSPRVSQLPAPHFCKRSQHRLDLMFSVASQVF